MSCAVAASVSQRSRIISERVITVVVVRGIWGFAIRRIIFCELLTSERPHKSSVPCCGTWLGVGTVRNCFHCATDFVSCPTHKARVRFFIFTIWVEQDCEILEVFLICTTPDQPPIAWRPTVGLVLCARECGI